jgi:hypothetical protein
MLFKFRSLFEGKTYRHRSSNQGDKVVRYLYEDLRKLDRSKSYSARVDDKISGLNLENRRTGIASRRGDGSFGELVPVATAVTDDGFLVSRGPLASIEIGTEAKVLAKAMIKQIDRVVGDLERQVAEFKRSGNPITVAVVGVNCAQLYTSYELDREWPTTGTGGHKHPFQEAPKAIEILEAKAKPLFDEFLILRFSATNVQPYPFTWVEEQTTLEQYSAMLSRISALYERRFR